MPNHSFKEEKEVDPEHCPEEPQYSMFKILKFPQMVLGHIAPCF